MWCRHKWEESERFYERAGGKLKVGEADAKSIERLFLGVTTILFKCKICGHLKT